ncbi:glycosyltransferase [Croceicoccus bisphenolivorans]|uniref:glycosyltransferase n=1 Tax=Croceicoccus bisphenolivorans TaxID=1783232 RepID=UPI000832FBA6|nr:glycosyltransferase [Croceicoccus bisphenolivorans]
MYGNFSFEPSGTPTNNKVKHGAGNVKLHAIPPLGKAALVTFVVITCVYFTYRIPLWNPAAPLLSTLLLAAELFGTLTLALHVISTWCLVERHAPPVPPDVVADIFLTTWNESESILRHSILAANQVRHCRHVWLLDDGDRPEIKRLTLELGARYLSRQERVHAKAGNLNNALKQSDADFIAVFDCDHAPAPEFLERTLGYFLDPSVALVQTPQDFYNVDSFQHRASEKEAEAWHEQTLFYRVIQAGKDFWNATFFCGSCAIVRRSAMEDIGGFATGTITEDMHTSLRLHKRGWSAVYHAEALAFGLSPTDLEQYETQRLRWGRGAMQVWRKERILTASGLKLSQRIAYFTSAITYFEGWQKAIVYMMPIAVLLTGRMPIIWTGVPFMTIFALWLLSGILVNEIFSRGYSKSLSMEEYNFLRFYTFIRATLAIAVPINWKFKVTPKDLKSRSGIWGLWPQLLIAAAAVLSIPAGAYQFATSSYLPAGAFFANVIWATLVSIIAIRAIRFASRRSRQRRSDHRFSIPLRATIEADGNRDVQPVIADEISSNGFSFNFSSAKPLTGTIRGKLALPGGDLDFVGKVMDDQSFVRGQATRRISVRFEWPRDSGADLLNSFLYGNALQWDVNGWAEIRTTPYIIRFFHRLFCSKPIKRSWQTGILTGADKGSHDCIVRQEGEVFRVLSLKPFLRTNELVLAIGQNAEMHQDLSLAGYRSYTSGGGTLHLAVLHRGKNLSFPGYHREPAWMRPEAA